MNILEMFDQVSTEIKQGDFLSTGWSEIDRDCYGRGLKSGRLVFLQARPKVGKSYMIINWMHRLAKLGLKSYMFSMEMSALDCIIRLLQLAQQESANEIIHNLMSGINKDRMVETLSAFEELITIDDRKGLSLIDIDKTVSATHDGVHYFFIDHIHKIQTRHIEIFKATTEITNRLYLTAHKYNTRLISAVQVHRGAEAWEIPNPHDAKGSGSIEEDADLIIGMCRPEINPNCEEGSKGQVHIKITANRFGNDGYKIRLVMNRETSLLMQEDECINQNRNQKYSE